MTNAAAPPCRVRGQALPTGSPRRAVAVAAEYVLLAVNAVRATGRPAPDSATWWRYPPEQWVVDFLADYPGRRGRLGRVSPKTFSASVRGNGRDVTRPESPRRRFPSWDGPATPTAESVVNPSVGMEWLAPALGRRLRPSLIRHRRISFATVEATPLGNRGHSRGGISSPWAHSIDIATRSLGRHRPPTGGAAPDLLGLFNAAPSPAGPRRGMAITC